MEFNCHIATQSQNSEVRLRILHLCGHEWDAKIGVWSPRPRPRSSPSPIPRKIGAAIPAMNCDIRWAEANFYFRLGLRQTKIFDLINSVGHQAPGLDQITRLPHVTGCRRSTRAGSMSAAVSTGFGTSSMPSAQLSTSRAYRMAVWFCRRITRPPSIAISSSPSSWDWLSKRRGSVAVRSP